MRYLCILLLNRNIYSKNDLYVTKKVYDVYDLSLNFGRARGERKMKCSKLGNGQCIINLGLSGWFRVRIVGRDDEDRLRSFARRYLGILNLLWIKTVYGLGRGEHCSPACRIYSLCRGGVLLRPLPEHLMKPKTGGAEPLPYEGNANHRKEIPKFLFCNSSEERANNVRPYKARQARKQSRQS